MAINWFPGHMNKARKEIAEAMPEIDLVIEIIDARLPYSSSNPLVNQLRLDKPIVRVMNKSDLADPKVTQQWLDFYNSQEGVFALAITTSDPKQVKSIAHKARDLFPHREDRKKNIRAMIMGIPNVGKSTIINNLAGRIVAKTGNEPAVTKRQQHIDLKNGIKLSDTPGILWPKIHNQQSGYRLATSGAIKDTALEYEDIGEFAGDFFIERYPEALKERFKLDGIPETGKAAIEAIGKKRGCLRSGGVIDTHKACEIFIHEIRSGKLGQVSFELPEDMIKEEQILKEEAERKAAEKEAKKAGRRDN